MSRHEVEHGAVSIASEEHTRKLSIAEVLLAELTLQTTPNEARQHASADLLNELLHFGLVLQRVRVDFAREQKLVLQLNVHRDHGASESSGVDDRPRLEVHVYNTARAKQ